MKGIEMWINVTLKSGEKITLHGSNCYHKDNDGNEIVTPIGDMPQGIIDELIVRDIIKMLEK